MKTFRFFAFAILLLTIQSHAESVGPFLSLQAGHLRTSFTAPAGTSADEPNRSWAVGGGYRFNQYTGIEGGFRDFGTLNLSGSQIVTSKMSGWSYGAFAAYPLSNTFEALVRAGWIAGKIESTNTTYSLNKTTWRTEPYWGFGMAWHIDQRVSLGINWTRFNSSDIASAADPVVTEIDVRYRF